MNVEYEQAIEFRQAMIDMLKEQIKLLEQDKLRLYNELQDVKDKNEVLTEMLFKNAGLLHEQIPVNPTIAGLGREPWYKKQKRLEKAFKRVGEEVNASEKL